MLVSDINVNYFDVDDHFDNLYPQRIQKISAKHWTPIHVAKAAAGFLAAEKGSRILDIGSGIGKFCLIGAKGNPENHFYGVEQRTTLIHLAEKVKKQMAIENTTFITGNFTQLDLHQFEHFYFYNSFYENLVDAEYHIDESIDYSLSLYLYYTQYLKTALEEKPAGTRLVTYHGFKEIVPQGYRLVESHSNLLLRCWIKG